MFCLNSANLSREKLLSHVGKDLLNIKLPQAPMTDLGIQIREANWRIGLKRRGQIYGG